jgi:hypothetical protein
LSTHSKPPKPGYLMTSEPGSYARYTIVERKPMLIRQVLADTDYPVEVIAAVDAFRHEIATGRVLPLTESAPDVNSWNQTIYEFQGCTWLDLPWFLAETYFYRRLLEAVRYFQPGCLYRKNPFQKQKEAQMCKDVASLGSMDLGALPNNRVSFDTLFYSSLWGNRADLSNFDLKAVIAHGTQVHHEKHLLLIDDTAKIYHYLRKGLERVDFINDNVGADLLYDLLLADFILHNKFTRQVKFHLKSQPYFVSDAMPDDVDFTINLLANSENSFIVALAHRLSGAMQENRLMLKADSFWATSLMFSALPDQLKGDLAVSNLVILKGDVNYRRMLEDRHWPHETRLQAISRFFPAPFVHLRTLKGELIVGLKPGMAQVLQAEDPQWMINGKRGVIQFVNRLQSR